MYRIDGVSPVVKLAEVTAEDIDESVSGTVHLFQKRVAKTADVRVTVIGSPVFCVRIDSDVLDWRTDCNRLTYTPVEPPPGIEQSLHRYLDCFGLVFGAFDLCVGEDGQWWFLECNPSDQWYWLEDVVTDQAQLHQQLIDSMTANGGLRTEPWKRAVEIVARHEFLRTGFFRRVDGAVPSAWAPVLGGDAGWLEACYEDESLVTQIAGTGERGRGPPAVAGARHPQ
ncbi:hypothetical protein ACFXKT_36805, partial [Streptomyces mirabilis]